MLRVEYESADGRCFHIPAEEIGEVVVPGMKQGKGYTCVHRMKSRGAVEKIGGSRSAVHAQHDEEALPALDPHLVPWGGCDPRLFVRVDEMRDRHGAEEFLLAGIRASRERPNGLWDAAQCAGVIARIIFVNLFRRADGRI